MESVRLRLGQLLVDARIVTQDQLDEVLQAQAEDGRRLGTLLVERGFVNEIQLTQILSQQLAVPWVSLYHVDFSKQLLSLVPREVAEAFCLVPIYVRHVRGQGDTLYVAMDDPTNEEALRACANWSGLPTRAMIAAPSDIRHAVQVYYGGRDRDGARSPSMPSEEELGAGPQTAQSPLAAQELSPAALAEAEGPPTPVLDELPATEPPPDGAEPLGTTPRVPQVAQLEPEATASAEPQEPAVTHVRPREATPAATSTPPSARKLVLVEIPDGEESGAEQAPVEPPEQTPPLTPPQEPAPERAVAQPDATPLAPQQHPTIPEITVEAIVDDHPPAEIAALATGGEPTPALPAGHEPTATEPAQSERAPAVSGPAEPAAPEPSPAEPRVAPSAPDDSVRVELGAEMSLEELLAEQKGRATAAQQGAASDQRGPAPEPEPQPRLRPPPASGKILSLTLLDGTTLTLPVKRKRRRAAGAPAPSAEAPEPSADHRPADAAASEATGHERPVTEEPKRESQRAGPPPPSRPPPEPAAEADEAEQISARDVVAALRAAVHGVDATEIIGQTPRWEAMFSALLAVLLRKGLVTDAEFVEELKRI
jgi:hypothetical protein